MDSQTLLTQVRGHHLLSEEQLADVSRRFSADVPFHELTDALVDKGWLTRYQIERICAGQTKGLVLGQYRILEELGRGGFGRVFKATHLIMNRVVALKVISPEKVDDSRARAWFRREVLASTQFQHPNIVMAFDANEVDDTLFLVMEYVDGPNLAEAVKQHGPLPIGLTCALMLQATRGLQYADDKGMVHRDIKPANLLLPRTQRTPATERSGVRREVQSADDLAIDNQVLVKIVDFGLARLHSQGSANTLMGLKDKAFLGTPDFIAPEQARNIHDADIRADLYSLGCTFFFALTGRPPFKGKTPLEIVLQHLEQDPPAVDSLRPDVPSWLAGIVRRLMAKKPEQRFQSPGELAAELSFFIGAGAVHAAPILPPGPVAGQPAVKSPASSRPEIPALRSWALSKSAAAAVAANLDMPRTMVVPALSTVPSITQAPTAVAFGNLGADAANDCSASPTPLDKSVLQREIVAAGPFEPRFRELWRQWVAIVGDLVERRDPGISEAAYGALRAELLKAVQTRGPGTPAVYGLVESAAAPWLTLHSLHQTDPQTLASLRLRCKQLSQMLNLGRPTGRLGAYAAATLVLVVIAVAVFLIASGGSITHWGLALSALKAYATAHPFPALALSVPPIVLGAVYFMSRFARS